MKKIFILSLILLCTGCIRIDKAENRDAVIDNIVSTQSKPNTMALGYKYYLPLGVSKVYDKNYNQKFKFDDEYIYLYVDIVSYHYGNSLNFLENEEDDNYFYKRINNGNKNGYVVIKKAEENLYYIKIVYNYAKIESYAKENEINTILSNSLIILSSVEYNDKLIDKIMEDDYMLGAEKEYKINKPEDATSKFSEYLSEYVEGENTVVDLPEY